MSENNLKVILKHLKPVRNPGTYVFLSLTKDQLNHLSTKAIISMFREEDGISVIVSKNVADQYKLPYHFEAAWITLSVYSSLESVGLTAVVSEALAAAGISCNVVAAFHHDHIFIEYSTAEKALAILKNLSHNAS